MMTKKLLILACALALLGALVGGSVSASADPAESLANAEGEVAAAKPEATSARHEMKTAKARVAPVAAEAEAAEQEVLAAQSRVTGIESEVEDERATAAKEVASAEKSYEDEKSSKSSTRTVGIIVLALGLLCGILLVLFARMGQWEPNGTSKLIAGGGVAVAIVIGVVLLASSSSPSAPAFSKQTEELASAPTDPSAEPSAKLESAQAKLESAEAAAAPIEAEHQKLYEGFESAHGEYEAADATLTSAQHKASQAKAAIYRAEKAEREALEKAEKVEHEESEFREQATRIDYNELIKNPDRYKGEKVVYEGQIFQIQEEAGFGFMLLSVTDEGYGFWDDNIWVEFSEPIEAAEEDIITVYGKITGAEEYETQIGGSTYVPKMNAVYIDE